MAAKTCLHFLALLAPISATLSWLATLLALLFLWQVQDGGRDYFRDGLSVLFISDVGTFHQKAFIAGAACTFVFFTATLVAERLLRHYDRLPGPVRRRAKYYGLLAMVFGFIGGLGLLLLAIFNVRDHGTLHWSFAITFIVGVGISSLFQSLQIFCLMQDHRHHQHLARNLYTKLFIVIAAIAFAIAFAATYLVCGGKTAGNCTNTTNASAILEWTAALLADLYLATFVLDLYPACTGMSFEATEEKYVETS
ncbi:hypothetical protein P389DRAFT_190468 [Cystobasidium minutum MCA 4210]|uniref:uncharacterized protein n=1 Tax=Cystobasidium minutum MCA 4210 TaxID=1397322 RepID=UPI0034CF43CA|eukprot:jgi/Rhomi1/190468/estExt_fgenesh1_pg.C_5_t10260